MSEHTTAAAGKFGQVYFGPVDRKARFVIEGADFVLTADQDAFAQIPFGDLAPPAACMSGKLTMKGDMGLFMSMGNVLG